MNSMVYIVSNVISYVCLTALVGDNEILQWIYTIVFAISVLFPIVWMIIKSVKDKKITEEEYEEIQKKLEEAEKKLKDEMNKNKKEDE